MILDCFPTLRKSLSVEARVHEVLWVRTEKTPCSLCPLLLKTDDTKTALTINCEEVIWGLVTLMSGVVKFLI